MMNPSKHATTLLIWGIVIHLFCDWILQNQWMAENKMSLKHPAAYVHSGIHLAGLLLIFPWYAAVAIAITHLLIDTRVLVWWRGSSGRHETAEFALMGKANVAACGDLE
jgi:hypothetical protein